ncbi:hypothetical protein RvY_12555-2 [Ramazzottius varieornatus]|uniref:Uncharacterized protein n=1 Tax=Ramazzottius varieornatus TaxID=947166 RepID=A0A1D1VJY2_RAMVA|nr:hypothetical protein RvY_12555-2 [Ramazzottius varieornatus]
MAVQRFIHVVVPISKPAPPRPPKLRAHHYECCACQKLITHECASDWKTSPILQTADTGKVAALYKERKQATTFDFAKYLRSEEEFCDLYVANNNRTIKCWVCQTMAHPIKSRSRAPHRGDLMAHVRGPKHRKKKEEGYIQDILGEEE